MTGANNQKIADKLRELADPLDVDAEYRREAATTTRSRRRRPRSADSPKVGRLI
jgi:hypothetical protein